MDTTFDILQAVGIGAGVGIRPFLPALLVGALASADVGIDFDGTDFAFLEEPWFLLAMLFGVVAADLLRGRGAERQVMLPVCIAVAALLGAGSLADHAGPVVAGLIAGAAAAVLAFVAIEPVFARVQARLGADAGLLPFYREGLALAVAGVCVLFPPLAVLVVGALVFLLFGGQRREGEKYAGLRILR